LKKNLLYAHNEHTRVGCYSDVDWTGSPNRSTFRYCVSIGDSLISLKIKKQNVVARSRA